MVLPCVQQAQRRILEEQYAANPPAKASRGTAASIPRAAAPRQAVKCAAPTPEKIPEAVTALEVEMKAVAPEPEAAATTLEQSPAAAEADAADTGAGDPPVVAEAAEAQADAPDAEAHAQVSKQNFNSTLKTCRRQRPAWPQSQEMEEDSRSAGSRQVAERVSRLMAGFGFLWRSSENAVGSNMQGWGVVWWV